MVGEIVGFIVGMILAVFVIIFAVGSSILVYDKKKLRHERKKKK